MDPLHPMSFWHLVAKLDMEIYPHNKCHGSAVLFNTLSEQTTPYNKGDRRKIKSHGLKCTGLYHTTPYNSSLIFLHKPILYRVVC